MSTYTGEALWAPSTQMGLIQGNQTIIVSGDGPYVTTAEGQRLFDASAALWYANLGHAEPRLVEAARRQMSTLETFQTWGGFLNPRAAELADRLVSEVCPIPNAKVMLGSGGSDAAELAFKLARLHWQREGRAGKRMILSRQHSYHGLHAFGTSLEGNAERRALYGGESLIPETGLISHDDLDAVRAEVDRIGADRIAAIVAEPVIGSGGVYPPAGGYLEGLRALCDAEDILLIFDEVITGFGRTGSWFASDRYGVVPDMTMFAKGITCGYFPLGGVFVAEPVWRRFWGADPRDVYNFGVTYSGHATGCAIALKVLDILEQDDLLPRVRDLEIRLRAGMEATVATSAGVRGVRVAGLMGIVEFEEGVDSREVSLSMRESHGVLARPLGGSAIAVSPAFIVSDAEIDNLIDALATGPSSVKGHRA